MVVSSAFCRETRASHVLFLEQKGQLVVAQWTRPVSGSRLSSAEESLIRERRHLAFVLAEYQWNVWRGFGLAY